jgi:hypothetical protein
MQWCLGGACGEGVSRGGRAGLGIIGIIGIAAACDLAKERGCSRIASIDPGQPMAFVGV